MRGKHLAVSIILSLSLFGLWTCGRDNSMFSADQPLPVEGDAGADLFAWAIGPIDGFTTVWHPVPGEITVPIGTTLRFKCEGESSVGVQWSNAVEVSRGDLGSIAECHIDSPGRHEVRVAVGEGRTWRDRVHEYSDGDQGSPRIVHTCVVNAIAVSPDEIGVMAVAPRIVPLTLTNSSSNYETVKVFLDGNSISRFRRVGLGRYLTAVNRPVGPGATLTDPRFASIIETRISGQRPILGAETIEVNEPGEHTVSVGPPTRAQGFMLETYKVSITSHVQERDVVPEGEPVTFVAKTDPPGYEDEITWIASTKYGEALPVVGYGPTFTVHFQSTLGSDGGPALFRWLGVRADNAVFIVDQPIEQELALRQLTIDLDHVVTSYSSWGHAELTFIGSASIRYFNLNVNGQWRIQNMPVQSVDGVGLRQGVTFGFDLGVSVGTQVTSVGAGWALTSSPLVSMPAQTGTMGVTQYFVYEYFGIEDVPGAYYTAPPVLIGGQAQEPVKHNNENFPNQECGLCRCVPTGVSNSLKFLKARHKLTIADAAISPAQMEAATDWNYNGDDKCPYWWWATKNTYMQDHSIPITTVTSDNIAHAIKAIDKGCDVEIWARTGEGSHLVALVGVTSLGDGKYAITVKHDIKQNEAGGTGTEGTQEGTYNAVNKKITGGIQWLNDADLINFVIECPTGVDPGC